MSKWSPLVHGRTFDVDFRMIAVPRGFTPEDSEWAKRYILGTFETFTTERIEDQLRWSVFKNARYCVVGVTCRVRQISADMDKDQFGRPLTVFLGYVTNERPFPALPDMNLQQFSGLYRLVEEHWLEKSWQAETINEQDYTYELPSGELPLLENIGLNTDPHMIWLWPRADDTALWTVASAHPGPISLCLGLSRERSAQEGPFLNASMVGITRPISLQKPLPPPSTSRPPSPALARGEQSRQKPPLHTQNPRYREESQKSSGFFGSLSRGLDALLGGRPGSSNEQPEAASPPIQTKYKFPNERDRLGQRRPRIVPEPQKPAPYGFRYVEPEPDAGREEPGVSLPDRQETQYGGGPVAPSAPQEVSGQEAQQAEGTIVSPMQPYINKQEIQDGGNAVDPPMLAKGGGQNEQQEGGSVVPAEAQHDAQSINLPRPKRPIEQDAQHHGEATFTQQVSGQSQRDESSEQE